MWFCDACTFQNSNDVNLCSVCGTGKSNAGMAKGWTCNICTFANPVFFDHCGGCLAKKEHATGAQPLQAAPDTPRENSDAKAPPDDNQMQENHQEDDWPDSEEVEDVDGVPFVVFKKICETLPHVSSSEVNTLVTFAKDSYKRQNGLTIEQVQHTFEANSVAFDQHQFEATWKSLDTEGDEMEVSISNNNMEEEADSWGDNDDWSDEDFEANGDVPEVNEDQISEQITAKMVQKETEQWKIYSIKELFELRKRVAEDWASFLGFENDLEKVVVLCHHYRWNRDRCIEDLSRKDAMKDAGLETDDVSTMDFVDKGEALCQICFCPEDISKIGWIDTCKHQVCIDCWGNWLKAELESKGPSAIFTKCPGGCKLVVPTSLWERFLPKNLRKLFQKHLATSFVQGSTLVKQCPGKDCDKFAYFPSGGQQDIECVCGEKWCFNCSLPAHEPCSCHHAQLWEERNASDKDNVNWIRANTKKCPNCHSNIEKNQGCMHMRCANCRHEFCWMCGQTWFNHRNATHSGCNKSDQMLKTEREAQKAKGSLQRYMFYYSRFEAHQKSLEFARKNEKAVERRMNQMMEIKADWNFNEVTFLKDAVEEVVRCRRILQWTYCFGFYLADGSREKNLFEDHQGRLEVFADRLHELTEKDVTELLDQDVRTSTIRLTKTVTKFRTAVSDHTSSMIFVEYKEKVPVPEKPSQKKKKKKGFFPGFG